MPCVCFGSSYYQQYAVGLKIDMPQSMKNWKRSHRTGLPLDMSLAQAINHCFARDLFDAFTKEWRKYSIMRNTTNESFHELVLVASAPTFHLLHWRWRIFLIERRQRQAVAGMRMTHRIMEIIIIIPPPRHPTTSTTWKKNQLMKRYLFWKSYLTLQIIVSKSLQQSFCLLCLSSSVLKTLGLAALEHVTDKNMQNKLKYT